MGIFQAGLLIPNAAGPILGGALTARFGWRAIFWFLTIYGSAFLVTLVLFLPETLRALVGNGSIPARSVAKSPLSYIKFKRREKISSSPKNPYESPSGNKKTIDILGPLRLIFGIEVSCAIFFVSIYYTGWQMNISSMSTLFSQTYGLTELQIGLTFLGNGFGCIIGTLSTGKMLDYDYRRLKKHYTGASVNFPLEKARFQTLWIWSSLQCAAVLGFGWTLDRGVHISAPIICTFVLGWSTTSIQSIITTFLVDVFPDRSASAVAALNLTRCLIGAGGTAAVVPIVDAIGIGWTFTLVTGVMVLSSALVVVQMRYGARWRRKREQRQLDI
jgi:predicted MFS family arabinose efflux permease